MRRRIVDFHGSERKDLFNHRVQSVDRLDYAGHVFVLRRLFRQIFFDQFRQSPDVPQRCLHFVSHSGNRPADRGQNVHAAKMVAEPAEFFDVLEQHDGADRLTLFVGCGRNGRPKVNVASRRCPDEDVASS